MWPSITAILAASLAITAKAHNTYNSFRVYESKDCSGEAVGYFAGDSDLQQNFVTYYNGYVGSIIFDEVSDFGSQLNDDLDCIYTGLYCCAGAPSCRLSITTNWFICHTVDERVSNLIVSSTFCDTICRDNIYGREGDLNGEFIEGM